MIRTMYWGAGAALIIILMLMSMRIYKMDTPDNVQVVEPIQWECMPGHDVPNPEIPGPMPSH